MQSDFKSIDSNSNTIRIKMHDRIEKGVGKYETHI